MRTIRKNLWGKDKEKRDEDIYQDWLEGKTTVELVSKYKLCYQWIWRIIKKKEEENV